MVDDPRIRWAEHLASQRERLNRLDAHRLEYRCGTRAYKLAAINLGFHPLTAREIADWRRDLTANEARLLVWDGSPPDLTSPVVRNV